MRDLYILFLCFIAGISTMIGCIFIFIPYKYKDKVLTFGFGLSFIVMFLISVIDLVPHGLSLVFDEIDVFVLAIFSFVFMFFGVLLIKLFDKYIKGEELFKIGFLSMFSLLIHNIPEGMICAISSYTDFNLGLKMIFMIMLHNIPEGICIALPIYYSTKKVGNAIFYTFISGLGELVGSLLIVLFLKDFITDFILYIILMITAGIMIYLSVKKILVSALGYKSYFWLIMGVLMGIIVIFITL